MNFFLTYILPCIYSYLFGSISFSIILTKIILKKDIRDFGSGNAGGTNVARTLGTLPGLAVVFLDAFKCMSCIWIAQYLIPGTNNKTSMAIAGLFCIIGHMFPVFFKFKGGKGISSCAGFMLAISPIGFVILASLFVIIVAFTRYISLGSVIVVSLTPVLSYIFMPQEYKLPVAIIFVIAAALAIFMHRSNIKRLINGNESKFSFKKTQKNK